MDMQAEVAETSKELERKAKLSVEDRLFELEVGVSSTDVAVRGVLEVVENEMTELLKRIEKLEHGQVLATEFDRPLNEGRADD